MQVQGAGPERYNECYSPSDVVVINLGDHTQTPEFRAAREAYETYLHIETAEHHDACEQDYWWECYQEARIAAGLPRDAPERYGWRHLWDGTEHPHWLG